ncbi:hypothetical protein [Psychrobacter sp. I-STPA10]|uniref:hypothetical protein n=1 Tax=Psychrobacter sp. I-STPA10 TaxID=2585769 RepID=UPI001E30053F|nr:hypothetical protein [Psychrobacter sp. I-STPA10]
MSNKKLPKAVAIMVEKNNLVMAIKTLAEEENISMTEAKARIDDYEAKIKAKQQQNIAKIAKKQGIETGADIEPVTRIDTDTEQKKTGQQKADGFAQLSSGLNNHLDDIGYKKPLIPRWVWRLSIILVVMGIIFFALWRLFII